MSRWTHSICEPCYRIENEKDVTLPEEPVRITNPPVEDCCFCGQPHINGIYIRRDPAAVKCGGAHAKEI